MAFKLFLVNHTQFEYTFLCRSNFSQERCPFILPESWEGEEDDLEVMTEYVFREKLKHKKRYVQVEMFPNDCEDSDEESEENSDEEDLKDENRRAVLKSKKHDSDDEDDLKSDLS